MEIRWSESAERQLALLRTAYVTTDVPKVREVAERASVESFERVQDLLLGTMERPTSTVVLPEDVRVAFEAVTGIDPSYRKEA